MPETKINRVYCEQCIWSSDGKCHLNPPLPIVTDTGVIWDYPPTKEACWCSFGRRLLSEKEIEKKRRSNIAIPMLNPPPNIRGMN